ncbi:DUF6443 domain-containing protein [Parapedobacter tibetensis]|uniref:DUF6443 domain-containing protein n=1 Tax=Parapedobacter tibetensis TaxID=2972951 RepID=UPI00356B6798
MRYPITALLFVCLSITASGQLVLNQPGATGEYTAPTTITLSPGFHATDNFRAYIAASLPALGSGGSSTQNYVQVTRYLRGYGTPPPATTLTVADAMRDITYYDGFGRPLQELAVKAAPNHRDIVTPMTYDAFGRQDRSYLPYATPTGAGGAFKANTVSLQATYYNSPPTGVVQIAPSGGTTPSFSQTVFEPSPLNRVQKQGFPGQAWQPAAARGTTTGRTVDTEYATNNGTAFGTLAGTKRVALYRVTLSGTGVPTLALTASQAYAANELHVTVTTDENWAGGSGTFASRLHTTEEYTDKQGRVVLRRTFNDNGGTPEMLSTYYVYDDFGRLSYVLPPGADPDRSDLPAAGATRTAWLADHAYQYRYDGRGRMVEKQLPGKGREYIIYNKLDQVVATQDANRRAAKEWLVTKYDGLGRVVLTGIWTNGGTAIGREAVQAAVDNQTGSNAWEERTGTAYTTRSWPAGASAIATVLTEHFHDDYNVAGFVSLPSVYRPTAYSAMTHGLPTVSRVRVLGTSTFLWNAVYYDDRGNAVRTFSQHYQGGVYSTSKFDDTAKEYSFTRQVKKETRKHHTTSATTPAVTVTTEYGYDHRDRPVDTWKTVSPGSTRTLIARNGYNEVGQLMKKGLHVDGNGSAKQTVAYTYNERGWLRTSTAGLFAMDLKYEKDVPDNQKQYNGNISRQGWGVQGNLDKVYDYRYDRLDRLVLGTMAGNGAREAVAYDRMGNITALNRMDATGTRVDSLGYDYTGWGNRLKGVADRVTNNTVAPYQLPGTTGYTYDANGNLLTRSNAANDGNNLTVNGYNHLNLPQQVTTPSGTVNYTYDATGRKLRKTVGSQATEYIDGIHYNGTAIEFIQTEVGRAYKGNSTTYGHEYTLTDHLGNARVGFDLNGGTVRRIQADDYYPFGLVFNSYLNGVKNKYLYNGKELQDELKQYDYGARFYDPVIGRWGTVDPLAELYENVSPYNYTLNNPIRFSDPDGMSVADSVKKDEPKAIELEEVAVTRQAPMSAKIYFGGERVMGPVYGLGSNIYHYFFRREFIDNLGQTVYVDNDGKTITPVLGGTAPTPGMPKLNPTNALKLGKALKSLTRKGNMPKQVDRVDIPKLDPSGNPIHGQQTHIHLNDGRALNMDGTWKHGSGEVPNAVLKWIEDVAKKVL